MGDISSMTAFPTKVDFNKSGIEPWPFEGELECTICKEPCLHPTDTPTIDFGRLYRSMGSDTPATNNESAANRTSVWKWSPANIGRVPYGIIVMSLFGGPIEEKIWVPGRGHGDTAPDAHSFALTRPAAHSHAVTFLPSPSHGYLRLRYDISWSALYMHFFEIFIADVVNPEAAIPYAHHTAVRIKSCGHVFGSRCLQEWLSARRTCPLCRTELFPTPSFADEVRDLTLRRLIPEGSVPYSSTAEILRRFKDTVSPSEANILQKYFISMENRRWELLSDFLEYFETYRSGGNIQKDFVSIIRVMKQYWSWARKDYADDEWFAVQDYEMAEDYETDASEEEDSDEEENTALDDDYDEDYDEEDVESDEDEDEEDEC